MRPGGGYEKGAEFERKTCEMLSLWITAGARDDLFWRTAMSGGRATIKMREGSQAKAQAGDIGMIDPLGATFLDNFFVEVKHHQDLLFHYLIVGGKSGIVEFWRKTCNDAGDHDKFPLMIVKQNRVKTLWCIDSDGIDQFSDWEFELPISERCYIPHTDLHIYLFDDVLRCRYKALGLGSR